MQERAAEKMEQDGKLRANMDKIKHKLVVISGKGGVGKSTVSVNLAYGLALKGFKVGILDVDIHGPNVPKMLGVEGKRMIGSEVGIEPVEIIENLKAVSMSFLLETSDSPVVWRGPLKMGAIKQFLSDVNWGELDYLVIDSPPGTGDEPLTVCQLIPEIGGAIIVTTPQDVALLDSRKSVNFAKSLKMPIIGIVENMSGLICPHCQKKINLFKAGGGEKAAADLKVPFLGRIPLDPEIVELADSGKPFIYFGKEAKTTKAIEEIIQKVEEF